MTPPEEAVSIPMRGLMEMPDYPAGGLLFSQDGRTLLVGNHGPTAILDVWAGKEVARLPFSGVSAFSANGATAAARPRGDNQSAFWDLRSGREIAASALPTSQGYREIFLSADGKQAAIFFRYRGDKTITLCDIGTQQARTLKTDLGTNPEGGRGQPEGTITLKLGVILENLAERLARWFSMPPSESNSQ
jgi:hypothetical protein